MLCVGVSQLFRVAACSQHCVAHIAVKLYILHTQWLYVSEVFTAAVYSIVFSGDRLRCGVGVQLFRDSLTPLPWVDVKSFSIA